MAEKPASCVGGFRDRLRRLTSLSPLVLGQILDLIDQLSGPPNQVLRLIFSERLIVKLRSIERRRDLVGESIAIRRYVSDPA